MRYLLVLSLLASLSSPLSALASSDTTCSPYLSLEGSRDCSNLPYLTPENDSRINLRLLIADEYSLAITAHQPRNTDDYSGTILDENALVPFHYRSFMANDYFENSYYWDAQKNPTYQALVKLAEQLMVAPPSSKIEDQRSWRDYSSQCRSNNYSAALQFLTQIDDANLPKEDTQRLATTRLNLLTACHWNQEQEAALFKEQVTSPQGKLFNAYLLAAANFYNGKFDQALDAFESLRNANQDWVKETSAYMTGRTLLIAAQTNAVDEYGFFSNDQVDKALLTKSESEFMAYLAAYPEGIYAMSAKGLLRRVHWFLANWQGLEKDYDAFLQDYNRENANISLAGLIDEMDSYYLRNTTQAQHQNPMLLAATNLLAMRSYRPFTYAFGDLTWDSLQQQKPIFADHPLLFSYLQAAFRFFVDKDAQKTLEALPQEKNIKSLSYLGFSIQTLRGMALEQLKKSQEAEALWLKLNAQATDPYQKVQLQLALAIHYEQNGQLEKVFDANSLIQEPAFRHALIASSANPNLLRHLVHHPQTDDEHELALYTLLTKGLKHGRFSEFVNDAALLSTLPEERRTHYQYELEKFESDDSNGCSNRVLMAQTLANNSKDPAALLCMSRFFDTSGYYYYSRGNNKSIPALGTTDDGFEGKTLSELSAYLDVINNKAASDDLTAFALYKAIRCFARTGSNHCGPESIEKDQRKAWFQQLKTTYADSEWAQELKYYW